MENVKYIGMALCLAGMLGTGGAYPGNFSTELEAESEARLETTVVDEYDDKLPATGGIGTVLFTAGGISIVLIAGALFVMYMKKRNGEEEE